jgi:hypothetical protein
MACVTFKNEPVGFKPFEVWVGVHDMSDALTRMSGFLESKGAAGNVSVFINCHDKLKAYVTDISFDKESGYHTEMRVILYSKKINIPFSEISQVRVSFHDTENRVYISPDIPYYSDSPDKTIKNVLETLEEMSLEHGSSDSESEYDD